MTRLKIILTVSLFFIACISSAQSISKSMLRLPDTGENTSYTNTFGEDADYTIYPPFFLINGNGTVTDTVTGLMWQQADGGEMTIENAIIYCDTLTLGGYTDWRLPNAHEAFSILNHQYVNPSLDFTVFSPTTADYWWTSVRQANDSTKVWVTNAGGGIGNHPKSETISTGGTKRFDVRAVRDRTTPPVIPNHFTNNGDGTITDNITNLVWQKTSYHDSLTWEQALTYADSLTLAGNSDWRLPNIKELQSLNDESLISPSVNTTFFSNIAVNKYWSSTTLPNQTLKAWYLDTQFGVTTYDLKTVKHYLLCVRGNQISTSLDDVNEVKNSIIISPNPAKTSVTISSPSPSTIEFLNVQGQLLKSKCSKDAQTKFDISDFSKGVYIVIVKTGINVQVMKFIKN